ncbi:MAG: alpha/beta fold hydrolase [Bdellovibrio sp.]|jgi:esterase
MSSYLAQFNYQFIRPAGKPLGPDDMHNPKFRRFVFLHGLLGYGLNWRRIASGLQQDDIAFVFDQRGHGKSWKPLTGYAPEDYADDLELIMREVGWDSFILVGHSMGGRNALISAAKFPERVRKLVIEDIGPEAKPDAVDYYKRLLDSVPTPFSSKLAAKEFFLNEFPKLGFARGNAQTLGQYLYSNIVDTESGQADWRFSKEAMFLSVTQGRAIDHWAELEALAMPTLVIRGANSSELTQGTFDRMVASNPKIEGVVIPNAGHWVHSDQPDEFLRVLLLFASS